MNQQDDLFQPTLQEHQPQFLPPGQRPWNLRSQLYVAFLGGIVASTILTFFNSGRLGLAKEKRWLMLVAGLVIAVCAMVGVALYFDGSGFQQFSGQGKEVRRNVRLLLRVVAVGFYGLCFLIQRQADRLYQLNRQEDDAHDSLWKPGLLAVLGGGVFQALLFAAILYFL